MPKNTVLATATRNAQADALARLLDTGFLRLYTGAQPASPDVAVGAQVLLGTLGISAVSAPAAANGVLTFNAISSDTVADATGTATWFRAFRANGTTAELDGSIGTADANLILNTVAIVAGARLDVTGWTHTVPASGTGF